MARSLRHAKTYKETILKPIDGTDFDQSCGVVKVTQLRLRTSSFHEHGPSSEAVSFHECSSVSGVLFFHSMALASVRFYTLIFSTILVCLKVKWKTKKYIK